MSWSKHRIILLLFTIVFFVELWAYYSGHICIKPIILSLFLYSILLALGSYFVGMRYYAPIVNRLPKAVHNQKRIALSFDDGPNKTALPKLLKLLSKHNIKANFFFIGQNLEHNKNLAKELHQQGHLIGNHSYSHKGSFPMSSWAMVRNEIVTTNSLIEEITQQKNVYFRPPFGVSNPIIAKVVKDLNMTMIGWSLRSYDTVKKGDRLFEKLKKNINDRDIVLLHEIEQNLDVIDKFIEYAKQQGFTFVLLSDIEIKS